MPIEATTKPTTCTLTASGELEAGMPFSGAGEFNNVTGGLPSVPYSNPTWTNGFGVGLGVACATEKKSEDTSSAEETASSFSGNAVMLKFIQRNLGLSAPDIVDDQYVSADDASFAMRTNALGVEYTHSFGRSGLAVGGMPFIGLQKACDSSTGDFGSVDCQDGSIITNTSAAWFVNQEDNKETPSAVVGVDATVHWDPFDMLAGKSFSKRNVLSGLSFYLAGSFQGNLGQSPLHAKNSDGHTHRTEVAAGDGVRSFGATWEQSPFVGAFAGLRFQLKFHKPDNNHFAGYQISKPEEKSTEQTLE